MTDPIADMFNRIRNAAAVQHEMVHVPYSRMKAEIADVFAREGFLKSVSSKKEGVRRHLLLHLLYDDAGTSHIRGIQRTSTPGRRLYTKAKDIKPVKQGHGRAIISTSQGIVTDREARTRKLGGEIIGIIW